MMKTKYNLLCLIYIIIVDIIWFVTASLYWDKLITGCMFACFVALEIVLFRNQVFVKRKHFLFYILDLLVAMLLSYKCTRFICVFGLNSDLWQRNLLWLSNFFLLFYAAGAADRIVKSVLCRGKKDLLWTAASVSFSFLTMFFIFLPSEVMLNNLNDYMLAYQNYMIPGVVLVIIGLVLSCLIICGLDKKLGTILVNIIFSVLISMYVQNYFMNRNIGILNGQLYDWKKHMAASIWNLIIWIAFLLFPFLLHQFRKNIWNKVIIFVSILLLIMQGASLTVSLIRAPKEAFSMRNFYFDNSEQYYVGREENVILFVLDAVDNRYVMELLEKESDVFEKYRDFTLYTNTCSVFDETFNSMPQMLSGSDFNSTPADFTEFYNRLYQNDYPVYAYNYQCGTNFNDVKNYFANCIYTDAEKQNYEVHYEGVLYNTVMMTLYQTLPNILKPSININKIDFSNLVTYESQGAPAMYENDDFHNNMILQTADDGKRFIIQHIDGAHAPKDDYVKTTEEVLDIVYDYIEQLMQLGLYDDSVIIITADHGLHDDEEELFQTAATPIFLIKEKNNHFDEMKITNAPEYHTDLLKTILVDIGLYYEEDGDRFGCSIYDFKENELRERRWYNREFNTYYGYYYEYTYTGDTEELIRKVENGEYEIAK